jgi:hypothetical protein
VLGRLLRETKMGTVLKNTVGEKKKGSETI